MLQRKEMTTLLVNVITAKMVLIFPKILIENSANAAWLQAVYNIITAFLLFLLISQLYKGKKNVIELAEAAGGRFFKIVIGITVFVLLMLNYASIIRVFPETIKIVLLQNSRVEIITIVFEAVIAIGAYIGLESIVRINYMFMPILGGVLFLFLIFLIPYYNIYNILPILGNGADTVFISGFNSLSMFSDLILLNILLPFYENTSEAKKSGRRAIVISAAVILSIILAYCLVYPYPASGEFMIPVYQLTRMIHLSSFFSRFEAVFQFAWSIMLLLYSAIYVYALSFVWQTTFNLKFYKPLIFPIVIISGIVALIPDSLPELIRNEKWENIIVYPTVFLMMFVFALISRRYYGAKKGRRKNSEKA